MRGTVDEIKERLDIAEIISGYIKVNKAGKNFKACCPFHNEKTPSFFISPERQTYYCFGCGAKGDIFTFVEEMEGLDFRGALEMLAEKAGVEVKYQKPESKTEKDKLYQLLEVATLFFEQELEKNKEALAYLVGRGVNQESIKLWRLGFAPNEWRSLFSYLTDLGYTKELLQKAGLIKVSEDSKDKNPYDVFRDRVIFPLFDVSGRVIAFSGRALSKDTEPKYLNSPDTLLFTKSEVLYGLDKAKDEIRKKNYAILVEGQMDLVLSHQAGVKNTVASSGTAFTSLHLERLRRLTPRLILAFDGDEAGEKAAEKSAVLGLSLGLEVKVTSLPEGRDPADLVKESADLWKEVLRKATHAIEHFLSAILAKEQDHRKVGKAIEKKILPLIALLNSSIERSHFVSLITKMADIKEEIIWDDLKRVKPIDLSSVASKEENIVELEKDKPSRRAQIEDELEEVKAWLEEEPTSERLKKHREELEGNLRLLTLTEERGELRKKLLKEEGNQNLIKEIQDLDRKWDEEKRKLM